MPQPSLDPLPSPEELRKCLERRWSELFGLLRGIGFSADVSHDAKKNALTVPVEAARQHGDNGTVLVVDAQNTVEEKHVKIGQSDGTWLEIISGLNEGERVIVGHLAEYRTGQKVQPKERSNDGASGNADANAAGDR